MTASDDITRRHRRVGRGATRSFLLALLWFGAVSAFAGGILGIVFNGAGLPLEYLDGTPFGSYVIPGVILGVVVGGTQFVAAVVTQRNARGGAETAAAAGFGMMIWIFAELAILGVFSWLQVVYFALGLGEVVVVLVSLRTDPNLGRNSGSGCDRDDQPCSAERTVGQLGGAAVQRRLLSDQGQSQP